MPRKLGQTDGQTLGRTTGRIITILALMASYLVGSAALAAPAQAQVLPLSLACLGQNHAAFSPGLTFRTRTVDIEAHGSYTCLPNHAGVTSGTYTASGEGRMSCLSGGHAGEFTIHWDTGEHSTIEFTNSIAVRPTGETVVHAYGSVIDGAFAGDRYDGTFTLFHLTPLACFGRGVRSVTGPTTLLFTSL